MTPSAQKLSETQIPDWRNADPKTLEPHFCNWMLALTSEGLHDKGDIAIVLAMLSGQVASLERRLAGAYERREGEWERMLEMRNVRKEAVCKACSGYGVRVYGSTSTWRGGIGGQMMTPGTCDKCWGSGSAHPWPSHRSLIGKQP